MGMYAMDKSDPEEYNWVSKKENGYDLDAKMIDMDLLHKNLKQFSLKT